MFPLDSRPVNLREVCLWEVIIVVPDTIVVYLRDFLCFPVGEYGLVIPQFIRVLVSCCEGDIDVILK